MSDKKVSEITIMDITERMLNFTMRNEIAEAADYAKYNDGTRDALNEMREDMQNMTETEFIKKYDEVSLIKGDELFDLDEEDPKAQYLTGYCNTVEDVMSFINPAYTYDQMSMLAEGIECECGCDECSEDCHDHDHSCGCEHCN